MADIIENGSTESKLLIKNMPFVELIKSAAGQLSKNYEGNIKIEVNVQKATNEIKCNVTEYDL